MLISSKTTLNCRGRLLDLSSPIVMGILNVTPDSFYDGGRYGDMPTILNRAEKIIEEGATIIDIGGMLPVNVELSRSIPAVKAVRERFPEAFISIDTAWAEVAHQAVDVGADTVNDISSGSMDETLIPTVGQLGVPYILMHMQGKPQTMQNIQILDLPVLVGLSRKSMIYKVLETTPDKALNGTTALHMVALQNGAKILRVHDVREAVEVVKLYHRITVNTLE